MASYTKRGDSYLVRYRESPGGPQKYRTVKTAREARALAATIEADIARGLYVDPALGRISLVDAMTEYIESRGWRHNTLVNARNAVEHVRRRFGDRPIGTIRTSDLQSFVTSLDLEPRTVGTIFQYLRMTIRSAHLDGVLGRDPTRRVRLPQYSGTPIRVPADKEIVELHAAAPEEFAVAVVVAAGLGLRASEAAGLTVDRINFLRREVTVDRQWHGKLDRFEPPKSPSANRTIPASDDVLEALASHLERVGTGEHGLLLHADGRPLNSNRMDWRWELIVRATGTDVTMHDLRHHFASSLISAGCSIVAVQRALGHAKPSTTLDTYGHLMPSDEDRIRSAIDAVWTGPTARTEYILSTSTVEKSL